MLAHAHRASSRSSRREIRDALDDREASEAATRGSELTEAAAASVVPHRVLVHP
jgi:hypothetical protein